MLTEIEKTALNNDSILKIPYSALDERFGTYAAFLTYCLEKDLVVERSEEESAVHISKSSYWQRADRYRDWR